MKSTSLILTIAWIVSTSLASAVTLISNLGQPNFNSGGVTSTTRHAVDFTTGATSSVVNEATVHLSYPVSTTATFEIWTSSGSTPASLLGTIGTVNVNSNTAALYTATNATGITLTPNTTYWLVLSSSTAVDFRINEFQTVDAGGSFTNVGGTNDATFSGGSWAPIGKSPLSVRYSLASTAVVPEPSRALLALGGFALVTLRRRRK
jgi:MYXO-CTERM domain-containing protein